MMQLAAPHTWPASIAPVITAVGLASIHSSRPISALMVILLLLISVLLQGSVNTINDYFDFVKGADTKDNQADPTDAVLVYNNVNPKAVLNYAIVLIVGAFCLGGYVIYHAGLPPLVIALIGVIVIVLYSGGRNPISYLPLGEVVSGFTMGGLITLASYQALTGMLDMMVLVWSLPVMLGIALIMLTNNTCDEEKDKQANRKTLSVLLGHDNACKLYHGIIYCWVGLICVFVVIQGGSGWIILPFMLLSVHPLGRALIANPLTTATRQAAFGLCSSLNVSLAAWYAAALLAHYLPLTFLQ